MGTSGARITSSAFDHDPTTTITDAAPARFLRLLRFLRLDLPHWEANQSIQRTGASRHAEWRCGRPGWLAPVADLGVRPQRWLLHHQPIDSGCDRTGTIGLFCTLRDDLWRRDDRRNCASDCRHREEGKTSRGYRYMCHRNRFAPRRCRPGLDHLLDPKPMSMIEPNQDGPANGRQPARRVAMRTVRVAGSRR